MKSFIGIIFTVCAALFGYMLIEARRNRVSEHTFSFSNLPSSFHGVRIFFISDLHFRSIHSSILREVKGKADYVFVGGDIMEKAVPFSRVEENLKKLTSIAPVYFVWGNNDYEKDARRLEKILRDHNVRVLANDTAVLQKNGERLFLIGVDELNHGRDDLEKAGAYSGDGFKVLLAHDPAIIDKLKKSHNISLVFSGHTHGGQIRLFGKGIREKGGIKQRNGAILLLSNGYGTTTIPMRLGAPAETHLLTLVKDDK
ncbi:metallophosphoesterase [Bacillus sp. FJAT-44742]|uniref:metallophosphoesterase n=1 Tax=Bacillus sp. FJAT-44742 TaxID=2014005 RepID=UPI001E4532B2|nr:metallophosphoesterase [Bacillus sp. FJAT-44742]